MKLGSSIATAVTAGLLALLLAVPPLSAVERPLGPPAEPASPAEPAAEPQQPDRYAVPDGGPEVLVRFIEGILADLPTDEASRKKALAALNEAADRVLAANPTDEQLDMLVQLKVGLLQGQTEQIKALAEKLAAAGHARAARQVQAMLLMTELRGAMRGSREEALPAVEKILKQIIAFLGEEASGEADLQLGMMGAQVAEMVDNDAMAAGIYQKVAQIAAKSDNPRFQELAKAIEGAVRRLTLVGKPMEIRGTTLGGEPFDWSKYAGKTVLVDFWATWCGPCVQEVPLLQRLYAAYHEKGFEIVGISLDREREQLETFLKEREIPWVTLYEGEGRNPMADYYGVMGIPQMMLIGPDGKVISTRARGHDLEKLLADRFGPLPEAEKPEAEKPEE
ncbi:MAG: TlpA disulfide reductase family protein [Patescibacteria group bacterium]|nr:TlpA disulfide reductase family protein [Patescibacteria group bacterium]